MFYSGIDLHKDNCFITTVDDGGQIVKQERLRNVPEIILAYFTSLLGPQKVVVECTAGWYWLNDLLEERGIELVLAHAKYLKIAFTDIAVRAIQYFPEYSRLYHKILRRANEPIARTVVAKELARIVYHILRSKTEYRGLKGQPISHQKVNQYPRLKRRPLATPGKPVCLTDASRASSAESSSP